MSKQRKQRPQRDDEFIGMRIDRKLRQALNRAKDELRPRTTITSIVEDALERWLTERGFLPPPDENQ